ncbi:MAG: epoxyqueuosine reductase [Nitrospirae bacterium]|nr:epoxyqueuosine reductase [Nitrospirota bacterium]
MTEIRQPGSHQAISSLIMYNELKNIAFSAGLTAFGVGHIDDLRSHFDALSLEQAESLSFGISIAVRVSDSVLSGVVVGPTRHYLHHYKMLNLLLDQTALKLTLAIQEKGYNALPIPASQIIDWEKQTAHLSHKMIALRAGIGWIGRNNLLVHPEFGSKIRLATILTNMPFKTDNPPTTPFSKSPHRPFVKGGQGGIKEGMDGLLGEENCRSCRKCIEICPVSAIGETHKEWNKAACLGKLKYFAKAHNVGQYICGLCVKVCQPEKQYQK